VFTSLVGLWDDAKPFDHLGRRAPLVHDPLKERDVMDDAPAHLVELQAKGHSVHHIIHLY
jgi:hypothetical protein